MAINFQLVWNEQVSCEVKSQKLLVNSNKHWKEKYYQFYIIFKVKSWNQVVLSSPTLCFLKKNCVSLCLCVYLQLFVFLCKV